MEKGGHIGNERKQRLSSNKRIVEMGQRLL